MSDEYAPLTDEQTAAIASEFLLNAPPGEFNEVFNDVRTLMNNDDLLKTKCTAAFSQYNKEQFHVVDLPDGTKSLITRYGDLGDNKFLDPRGRQTFEFDHLRKKIGNIESVSIKNSVEDKRVTTQEAVDEYVSTFYPNGVSVVYGLDNGSIVVCIEGHTYNSDNFWNGKWRSEYIWDNDGNLTGFVKIKVHYYEDGNIQLNINKDVFIGGISNEKDLIAKIKAIETALQNSTNSSFVNMSQDTFKALRRALPITKCKIDWTKIANYNLGKELNN